MHCKRYSTNVKHVVALTVFVGALPFLFSASAHARETGGTVGERTKGERTESERTVGERTESERTVGERTVGERTEGERTEVKTEESRWLDDYSKPVGFTYGVQATVNTNYLWRGLYCGGLNIQPSANVGYGGLYIDMWWNIGATEWGFQEFLPEVDLTLGFNRWGLDIHLLYIHNFNCGFFDFGNYSDRGNRLELAARYTISSKLPLSILWATRIAASDGYLNGNGETVRAWSSYAEISYTHHFPYSISIYGAFGITPWRSCYTWYKRDFAVQNIEIRLRKDWSVSTHCGMMIQGTLSVNPSAIAADKSSVTWYPSYPFEQSINANLGLGIYLK